MSSSSSAFISLTRPGWLLASPALPSDLRFTGVLPADDSERALAVLTDALPVRVRRITPYVVWVD